MAINLNAKWEAMDRKVRSLFADNLANKKYEAKATPLFEEVDSEELAEDYNWMLDTFGYTPLKQNLPKRAAVEKRVTIKNNPWIDNLTVDLRTMKTKQGAKYDLQAKMKGRNVGRFLDKQVRTLLKVNGTAFTEESWDGVPFFSTAHPIGNTTYSNFDNGAASPLWFLFDTSVIPPILLQWLERPHEEKFGPDTEWSKLNREVKWDFHLDMGMGMTLWWFAYASNQTLNESTFAAAVEDMMKVPTYGGDADELMGVMPNLLVVGASNKIAAEKLLNATHKANGESNILYKNTDLLVLPNLA